MITLHSITENIKTLVKWAVILLFIILLVVLGLRMKSVFFPEKAPAPETKFSKLPPPTFPSKDRVGQITYTIDTLSGELPVFPDRLNVYKIEKLHPSLLSVNRAKERMDSTGFTNEPQKLSELLYKWTSQRPPIRTVLYNVVSLNFEMSSDFYTDPVVLAARRLGDESEAISTAYLFLNAVGSYPSDLDEGKTKTSLYAIEGTSLTSQTTLTSSQIIRIDFFQKNIDDLPIVYPFVNQSTMNLLVGSGDSDPQTVAATFFHQTVGSDSSTYPLKTTAAAFEDLQNNRGYIASNNHSSQVPIKNVSLAYYMEAQEQEFLQPVFVFEGENFLAYVSAVEGNFLE